MLNDFYFCLFLNFNQCKRYYEINVKKLCIVYFISFFILTTNRVINTNSKLFKIREN